MEKQCTQRDEKKIKGQYVIKKLLVKTIVFTSTLNHTVRSLLDIINQCYSIFATKSIYMLKTF